MRTLIVIVAAVLMLVGGRAHADDGAAAESMFQRGKEHMDAGRIAEACADFTLSEKLDSSVGTLLNLGKCHSQLGNTASAWAAFTKASVGAGLERESRRRDFAKERATALQPRLTQLRLQAPQSLPTGAEVTRNGEPATLVVGVSVPVDPGQYIVEVSAPSHETWSKTLVVEGEGETIIVQIPELVPVEAEVVAPKTMSGVGGAPSTHQATGVTTQFDSGPRKERRLIALGVGSVGLAAATTGIVFGVLANSNLSHSEEHCDSKNVCDQIGADLVDDTKTYANISTVLVGAGGLAMAAGVVLWLTAPDSKASAKEHALRAVPIAGRDGMGFAITGGF